MRFSTGLALLSALAACTSLPEVHHTRYAFPAKEAFVGEPERPYTKMGLVRDRADFQTLDPKNEEKDLCKNYYNKAVKGLVKRARQQGADAVVQIKSVVFYEGGQSELFSSPECSDDGEKGQILVQGIAVKWDVPKASPSPSPLAMQPAPAVPAPSGGSTSPDTVDPSGVTGIPTKAPAKRKLVPRVPRPDDRIR